MSEEIQYDSNGVALRAKWKSPDGNVKIMVDRMDKMLYGNKNHLCKQWTGDNPDPQELRMTEEEWKAMWETMRDNKWEPWT